MKRTLFLHVGTHKTGSTSIQHFLFDEIEALRNSGLELFLGRHPKRNGRVEFTANAWLLANQFIREDLLTVMRLKHLEQRGFIPSQPMEKDRLRKIIQSSECSEFLVSAESLCFLRTPAELRHMKKYLEKLSCDVVIIVCLRNLKDWQKSNCAQLAKMKYHGSHIDPLPASNRVDAKWYYNHDAIQNFWGQVGPVKVIDYDEVIKNDGNVVPSFMKTINKEYLVPKKDYFRNVGSSFKS